MQNKTARIITAIVLLVIVIGGFFAYIYRGKLKALFGRASSSIDLGFTNGIQPLTLGCPSTVNPDGTVRIDALATLTNFNHTEAQIVTATGVHVSLHVFSFNKSNPTIGFPGVPSWMQVSVNGAPVSGEFLTIPDLAPGMSATIHITGTVPADQLFNLTGEVSGADQTDVDSTPGNWENSDEDDKFSIGCTDIPGGGGGGGGGNTPQADLSLTKTAAPATLALNATTTFTVEVTNSGPDATSGVTVKDLLPTGLTYVSATASQGTYLSSTGVWNIGNMPVNSSVTLTLKAKIVQTGTILNTAEVTASSLPDPDSTPNNHNPNEDDQASAVVSTSIITGGGSACLPQTQNAQINQVVSFQVVASPGETVHTWDAPGGSPSSGTGVTFSTKYATAGTKTVTVHSDNNTGVCTVIVTAAPVGGDLVCSPSSQNAQTGQTVSFQVQPVSGISDPFTWSAPDGNPNSGTGTSFSTKYSTTGTKTVTVHVQNSTGTCTVVVSGIAPASLSCSPPTQTVVAGKAASFTAAGGSGSYTWTALGGSPDSGTGANFSTTYGVSGTKAIKVVSGTQQAVCGLTVTALSNLTCSPATQSVALNQAASFTAAGGDGTYAWNAEGGTPATGSGKNFSSAFSSTGSKKVTVSSSGDSFVCTVEVGGGGGGNPVTDLGVVKSVSAASVSVGSNVVFSMVVTNNGPLNATSVKLTDPIVTGLQYVTHTVSKGTYDAATGVWNLGDLAVGANANLSITTTVNQASTMTNVITITDVSPTDSNPANNKAQASVTGTTGGSGCGTSCGGGGCTVNCGSGGGGYPTPSSPSADLSLTKIASNVTPLVGTQITYILNLLNSGPSPAGNISLQDLIPSGETFVAAFPSQGSYDPGSGIWNVGSLSSGSSAALQLVVRIDRLGTIINTGEVTTSDTPDPDSTPNNHVATEDDQASVSITSHGSGILPAAGVDSRTSVAVGSLFLFMLFALQFVIPTKKRKFLLSFVVDSSFWSDAHTPSRLTEHKPTRKLKW